MKYVILLIAAGATAAWFPYGWTAALAAVLLARFWRWPRVGILSYVNSRKCALPAIAGVGGWSVDFLLYSAGSGGGFWPVVEGAAVAAAALAVLVLIFEGKLMKNIFDLVPEDEQAALAAQLDDLDAATAGSEGQAADLSALDPAAVTRNIEARVIGQNPIVHAVVTTTFRRSRLARQGKPVGVLLFVGATGAGKTELAKALAGELFHGRIIRIDCNELSESHNVQRLIGAPPGYVGADQGGQLCRDLARTGTGVLLLDEIEKAHPAALKVLMNLLDEARLTEQSTGRTYSARGFLIVLTSNAAASEIAKVAQVETDSTLRETKVKDALRDDGFLPEILARIDAVFPFSPLAARDVARVVERFLLKFSDDVGVILESCDSALLLDLVTTSKKTKDYGIREVVRSVENAVVDGLIDLKDRGHTRAAIHVRDGHVIVEPVATTAAAATAHGS